ncbi:MAG: hypothetical protein IPI34_00265 [bacterium]|nr:hypothetical protein [bacterium]
MGQQIHVEQRRAGQHLATGVVDVQALAVLQFAVEVRHQVDARVQPQRGGAGAGRDHLEAALHLVLLDAVQREGQPLARASTRDRAAVGLHVAHAHLGAGRRQFQHVAHSGLAAPAGAGHHDPGARHGEDPVHGQPEGAVAAAAGQRGRLGGERDAQVVQTLAGARRDQHRGAVLQERAAREVAHLLERDLGEVAVDQVELGDDDDAAAHPERGQDLQVLHGLGHDPLVRGHHQQREVDAAGPGDHLPHEALVAGHVDDAQGRAVRQGQLREAQFDADAALLLLLEAVGLDAGQRLDQRRLAVVHVAGGAQDEAALRAHASSRRIFPPRAANFVSIRS